MDGGKADADEKGEVKGDHCDNVSNELPEDGGCRFAIWTACGHFAVSNTSKAKAVSRAKIGILLIDSQLGRIVATADPMCGLPGRCHPQILQRMHLFPTDAANFSTDVRQ